MSYIGFKVPWIMNSTKMVMNKGLEVLFLVFKNENYWVLKFQSLVFRILTNFLSEGAKPNIFSSICSTKYT